MTCRVLILALGVLWCAGCQEGSTDGTRSENAANGESSARDAGGNAAPMAGLVEVDAIALTAPAQWQRQPTSSSFVAAEFALPRAEGDKADGRLTISTAGGGVQANIDRWKGQFEQLRREEELEETEVDGLPVTLVDYSGDFNDSRGPFAPGELRPNYRMIAAVIEVGYQLYFVKATGPEQTIAARAEEIKQFVRSVKRR